MRSRIRCLNLCLCTCRQELTQHNFIHLFTVWDGQMAPLTNHRLLFLSLEITILYPPNSVTPRASNIFLNTVSNIRQLLTISTIEESILPVRPDNICTGKACTNCREIKARFLTVSVAMGINNEFIAAQFSPRSNVVYLSE